MTTRKREYKDTQKELRNDDPLSGQGVSLPAGTGVGAEFGGAATAAIAGAVAGQMVNKEAKPYSGWFSLQSDRATVISDAERPLSQRLSLLAPRFESANALARVVRPKLAVWSDGNVADAREKHGFGDRNDGYEARDYRTVEHACRRRERKVRTNH